MIIDELVRLGVKDVVLSPGSRSAPLAYAVAAADKAGRLRLHVRVDERSAGFLALGLAKISRNPVPVITTSGTAVANLHPAVLEAHHAQVPLIIMSADRPAELRDTGANQTTDQVKIFGSATRWFHEFATPSERAGQNTVWRSVVGRAFAHATGVPTGDVGPVHLNLPFREPLTPDVADLAMAGAVAGAGAIVARDTSATSDEDARADDAPSATAPVWPESLEGRDRGRPWMQLRAPASTVTVAPGPGIAPVPRTLVLLGDLPDPKLAAEVAELADAAGWPVIAEPFGDYHRGRAMPHGSLILAAHDWLDEHLPERVLVAGRMTLSRDVAKLLRHPEVLGGDPAAVEPRAHRGEESREHTEGPRVLGVEVDAPLRPADGQAEGRRLGGHATGQVTDLADRAADPHAGATGGDAADEGVDDEVPLRARHGVDPGDLVRGLAVDEVVCRVGRVGRRHGDDRQSRRGEQYGQRQRVTRLTSSYRRCT